MSKKTTTNKVSHGRRVAMVAVIGAALLAAFSYGYLRLTTEQASINKIEIAQMNTRLQPIPKPPVLDVTAESCKQQSVAKFSVSGSCATNSFTAAAYNCVGSNTQGTLGDGKTCTNMNTFYAQAKTVCEKSCPISRPRASATPKASGCWKAPNCKPGTMCPQYMIAVPCE